MEVFKIRPTEALNVVEHPDKGANHQCFALGESRFIWAVPVQLASTTVLKRDVTRSLCCICTPVIWALQVTTGFYSNTCPKQDIAAKYTLSWQVLW
eukprot:scaffold73786_cov18-Prasinocladus_malaysianus.AAC.1